MWIGKYKHRNREILMGKITFTNHAIKAFPFEKLLVKSFLPLIFLEEEIEFLCVNYIFCSDNYLLGLNKEYLNHDTYTDILTFTLSDKYHPVASEIYISVDRVTENAQILNISFRDELYRVMIHGILHLCGYSDDTFVLKTEMTEKEDYYISKLCST